jgi:glycosyltransferase involved in cell wall biosynthesis
VNIPPGSEARVSVIIPVYGTAHFVAEALDSVLNQTYSDYEIIVVNDGSPDSKLLEEFLKPYRERITYIVQENRGLAGARNTGVESSRAKYVAMLDSDDRWHPEYMASQLSILEADASVDVVYPNAVRFTAGRTGTIRYSDAYPVGGDISFLRVLARECQIYGGVTARRETLLRVGLYDEDLRSGEDFDLWLRILKAGGRIVYNDHVLAYYRIREGSLTSNEVPLARNILKLLNKLGTKMELSVEERAALDHQRAGVVAKLSLAEGKQAFIQGDPETAITRLTAAARYTKSWKLRVVIIMLKFAPGILLGLYRLRERSDAKAWNSQISLLDQP